MKEDVLERIRTSMPCQQDVTLEDFATLFLYNHFKQCTSSYRRLCENALNNQLIPYFTKLLIEEKGCKVPLLSLLEPHDLQDYIDSRKSKGVAPKTIRNDMRLMQLLFKKAIDNGFLTENPMDWVKLPTNVPIRERDIVPDEEFYAVLRMVSDEVRKGLIILANTGLRVSELFALKRDNFDLRQGVLHLRSTTTFTTKNKQSRIIPLSDAVTQLVTAIQSGEPIMDIERNAFGRQVLKAKRELGYEWTVHELRHTYVSKQLKAGVDRRTLREWTGHKTDSMIEKYGHYIPDAIEPVRNNVNIGAEFSCAQNNVVTRWAPPKQPQQKTPVTTKRYRRPTVGVTGLEPVTSAV